MNLITNINTTGVNYQCSFSKGLYIIKVKTGQLLAGKIPPLPTTYFSLSAKALNFIYITFSNTLIMLPSNYATE